MHITKFCVSDYKWNIESSITLRGPRAGGSAPPHPPIRDPFPNVHPRRPGGRVATQGYRGWRTLVDVLEGLHGVCCHIIIITNLNHSQTTLGRGLGQCDS